MVRDLVEQSVSLVKQGQKEKVKDRAEQNVEDIILDALIPPVKNVQRTTSFQKRRKTNF